MKAILAQMLFVMQYEQANMNRFSGLTIAQKHLIGHNRNNGIFLLLVKPDTISFKIWSYWL